jgi:multicomponent Na+:H+ antiporter subunit F
METGVAHILIILSFGFLLAAMILALIRLFKGPESTDRIIALDLIASIVVAFSLLFSILFKNEVYFDIAIVITLVSFIGTIAISINLMQKK